MARYDVETFVDEVIAYVRARLPTKLAAIAVEKNDATVVNMPLMDIANCIFPTINEQIINCDPYIYIGLSEPVQSLSIRESSAEMVTLQVAIMKADDGADQFMYKKMYRYMRALKEIFEQEWNREGYKGPEVSVKGYVATVPPNFKTQMAAVILEAELA